MELGLGHPKKATIRGPQLNIHSGMGILSRQLSPIDKKLRSNQEIRLQITIDQGNQALVKLAYGNLWSVNNPGMHCADQVCWERDLLATLTTD